MRRSSTELKPLPVAPMPNFFIIGTAKAGTTSLYQYLKQHPRIYMSPVKEPRFFAFEGEKINFCGPGDQRVNRSSITSLEAYRALFDGVTTESVVGEASPIYLYSPKAAERIRHYAPDAKLTAILRNPVDRAYSQFLHNIRDGYEPLTNFEEAFRQEEKRVRSLWGPRWHYKQWGFYHVQLRRYWKTFGPSRIRVYLYEDFDTNPLGVLHDIFRFLDVDATFVPDTSIKYNVSGVPQNKVLHALLKKPPWLEAVFQRYLPNKLRRAATNLRNHNLVRPQLSTGVRKALTDVYREDILNLQELIRRDLSGWLR